MTINVFIPECVKDCQRGYLNGDFLSAETGIVDEEGISTIIIDSDIQETSKNCIGVVNPTSDKIINDCKEAFQPLWIIFTTIPTLLITCIYANGVRIETKNVNVIYYCFSDILQSELLIAEKEVASSPFCSVGFFVKRIKDKREEDRKIKYGCVNYLLTISKTVSFFIPHSKLKKFFGVCDTFLMKKFGIKSCFVEQAILRSRHIEKLLQVSSSSTNLQAVRIGGIILIDVLLGFLFFYIFYSPSLAYELHSQFQVATKVLASSVQILLDWLRGAPAGLKLNQPLSEALSYFFSYHVYLWTIYIDVASPVLFVFAYLFVYGGIFGLSFQIALMRDFLNLSVLHIHCFYIYAARLHMIQVSLLGSQWRGFRGRKWNPLKEREDARSEGRQRPIIKILSAVGFTFVIFLLPTTTVFYAVFLMLRLLLLSLQGVASLLLWSINYNPITIIWLHSISSSSIKGELHFEMEPSLLDHNSSSAPLSLKLSTRTSPLGKIISATHSDDIFSSMPAPNLSKMLCSLVYARDLI